MTEISEDERQRRITLTQENPWYKLALEGRDTWNSFIIKAYSELIQKAYTKANFPAEIVTLFSPMLDDELFETNKSDLGITDKHIQQYPNFTDGYFTDSKVNFRGFLFPFVNFHKCIFDIDFYAERAFFINGAGFNEAVFQGDSTFNDGYFEEANFSSAKFLQDIFFENTRFYGRTEFCDTFFRSQLLFKNVTANDDIEFDRTILQIGKFDDCKFKKSARFRNAEFNSIHIRDTTIAKNCSFFEAKFLGISQFNKTTFEGFVDFRKTRFSAQGNRVINQVNTDRIGFDEISPSFIGTDFKEGVDFQNAVFESPPHFEGAKCEIILLDNTTFKNPPKPDKDILHIYASAWAALIRLMEKVHNLPKRQEFHERLLEIDRNNEKSLSLKIIYLLYEKLGSGRLISPPLVGMAYLAVIFNWVYYRLSCFSPKAVYFTMAKTFPFISAYSQETADFLKELPQSSKLLVLIVSYAHSVIALILIFLVGLALRNRFKLK